ncbi:uncharacterized protein C2orf81 homolog isoform X2 [Haliotis rufescens]|uniref:uncharacterized protein C2orf81 homolog isoform X2 n=1 Tax=Haliotis rufescens TaxID=6454 RepID=UPI001EAFBEF6|nr:uncharacterized protein C2orf81 homolog isoform X2 [Haliotis rufescens]
MSRAAVSKSRADKGKPPAAQTPVITHEIVPGKFNDHDWNIMLDKDGTEDFILDLVDEVVDSTMDTIYKTYIDKQLLPFTISQAKDAILQIIDWQFLDRDGGEVNTEGDPTWLQDEEPDPATTDCWAQGSVPRTYLPPPTPVIVEETQEQLEEEHVQTDLEEAKVLIVDPDEDPELPDKVSEPDEDRVDEKTETEAGTVEKDETVEKKKKFKFKRYRGPIKSAGVSKITESLEDTEMKLFMDEIAGSLPSEDRTSGMLMPASCHSILRVQAGRPPGNKDVVYDDMGNVIAVVKLDPEKLPNHRVRVKYQVVDPAIEAAQARLEAMRHGKYVGAPQVPTIRRIKSRVKGNSDTASVSKSSSKTSQQPTIAPLPPPLIEAMEVAAGVTVKEGGRVKKGPNRYVRKSDVLEEHQKTLRPVASRIPAQALDVADLLDRTTPILRPIGESPPLPPIIPHPPTQSRITT